MKKLTREEKRQQKQQKHQNFLAEQEQKKRDKKARKQYEKEMQAGKKTYGLGASRGGITEYPDGTVEYRRMMEILPTFTVNIREVTGFSVRKVTKEDKKRLKNASMTQIFAVQGSGTVLGESPVTYGTADKIEQWFRAHPDFGKDVKEATNETTASAPSVADELAKLAELKESGVLTEEEFNTQKTRLLG